MFIVTQTVNICKLCITIMVMYGTISLKLEGLVPTAGKHSIRDAPHCLTALCSLSAHRHANNIQLLHSSSIHRSQVSLSLQDLQLGETCNIYMGEKATATATHYMRLDRPQSLLGKVPGSTTHQLQPARLVLHPTTTGFWHNSFSQHDRVAMGSMQGEGAAVHTCLSGDSVKCRTQTSHVRVAAD